MLAREVAQEVVLERMAEIKVMGVSAMDWSYPPCEHCGKVVHRFYKCWQKFVKPLS